MINVPREIEGKSTSEASKMVIKQIAALGLGNKTIKVCYECYRLFFNSLILALSPPPLVSHERLADLSAALLGSSYTNYQLS